MTATCRVPTEYEGRPGGSNVPAISKPSIADSLRGSAESLSDALTISEQIKRFLSFQDPVSTECMEIRDMESQVYDISEKAGVLCMNLKWIAQHLGV